MEKQQPNSHRKGETMKGSKDEIATIESSLRLENRRLNLKVEKLKIELNGAKEKLQECFQLYISLGNILRK